MKQYKKYKDIPEEYRFDLQQLLDGKSIEELIANHLNDMKKLNDIKDSKYNSPEEYLSAHEFEKKLEISHNKINNYLLNSNSVNVVDSYINQLQENYAYQIHEISTMIGSEITRIKKHKEKLIEWKDREDFKYIKKIIEEYLRHIKYTLDDNVEEYILKTSYGEVNSYSIFNILTNSELDYGYATGIDKKKIKITNGNRSELAKHKDKNIRKTSQVNYKNAFYKHRESLTNMLYQNAKAIVTNSKSRGYPSTIDSMIMDDYVDVDFLQSLYNNVSKNVHIFKPFFKNRARFYKEVFKEKMTKYDYARDIFNVKNKFTIEQAKNIMIETFKPFGEEYLEILQKALNERWIDFLPVENKTTGAYSIDDAYGIDKIYILMNFDGQLESIETLAHELGHSMHTYFSCKYQVQELADYPIILAEVASIFNELMLYNYLLENSKDDKLKFTILESMISGFIGTVVRQTEWSNYEFNLYNSIEKGEAFASYESIANLYYENSKKYSINKKKKFALKDQIYSVYVPHFYYDFYVYKYAVGQLSANIFFGNYLNDGPAYLQKYIDNFLKAGDSDKPLETLKKSGVNLYDQSSYEVGFKYVEKLINQYIKIGNKILKKQKVTKIMNSQKN